MDGPSVAAGVAGCDAVAGERRRPSLFGVFDCERPGGERVGCGRCEVDGVGMVDDNEVGPIERPDRGPPLDALEKDRARASPVVDGENVTDVVSIDGTHPTADVDMGAGCVRRVETGALAGRVVGPAGAFGGGGVAGATQQVGCEGGGDEFGDVGGVGVVDDDEVLGCRCLESGEELGLGSGSGSVGRGMPAWWRSSMPAAWVLVT